MIEYKAIIMKPMIENVIDKQTYVNSRSSLGFFDSIDSIIRLDMNKDNDIAKITTCIINLYK